VKRDDRALSRVVAFFFVPLDAPRSQSAWKLHGELKNTGKQRFISTEADFPPFNFKQLLLN
jgi:hypothetical protein